MTRTFRGSVACPRCGHLHSAESAFERWVRNQEELDSRLHGICRFDCDILLHRYAFITDKRSSRDVQCVMFIEVKTHGAQPDLAQLDTLSMFAQVLRNRRTNMHKSKRGRHVSDHTPLAQAYSHVLKKDVRLKLFGGHLLRLAGNDPVDSEWVEWDRKRISPERLIDLLKFQVDPDSMQPIDWRRRYSAFDEPMLQFGTASL